MRASRRLALFLALGAAIFALGWMGGVHARPGPSPVATKAASDAPARTASGHGVGPDAERAGMAVGFARSEAGARAAAIAYAGASQRWLYMSDEEVRAAVGAIATEASTARLADEVVAEVALARDALAASPGRVWWIVAPLASRVDVYGPTAARVTVWTVTVLSAPEVAVPQADWLSVVVDLEWHGGDWRVGAVDDGPGPTPMLGPRDDPWNAPRLDEVLAGFERVGEERP